MDRQSRFNETQLTPALDLLWRILGEAHPSTLSRERICSLLAERGRPTSRTALRQQLHRLEGALGHDSLQCRGELVRLSEPLPASISPAAPIEPCGSGIREAQVGTLVRNLCQSIAEIANFSRTDARALLISQAWISRSIPVSELRKLLDITRPISQQDHLFGEHRNLETLALMTQGLPKTNTLVRVEKSKKIARRYGQKGAYQKAAVLGTFAIAGEKSLHLSPVLGPNELEKLAFHQKLAHLAMLFLEDRSDAALRATEAMAPMIECEAPSDQLHFWANATVYSHSTSGIGFAAEARLKCEDGPSYRYDVNTQRCLQISLARERLCLHDVEGAESAAMRYKDISSSMEWSWFDYHEVLAQTSLLRGEIRKAKFHRAEWMKAMQCSGHAHKRFNLRIRKRLAAIS